MNERIKELAVQAGMILGDAGEFDMAKFMPKEVKFAELIVQECAEVADNADAMRQKWEGIGKYVRKHFGVEL